MEKRGRIIISVLLIVLASFLLYFVFYSKLTGKVISDRELVAHWNFDRASPILEYDSSGKEIHARLMNGAHTIEYDDKRGRVLLLDGVDDYAFAYASSGLDITNRFTFTAWIYSDNNDFIGTIFSKESLKTDSEGSYNLYAAKNLFRYELNKKGILESGGISTGEWYHVALTYDFFSKPQMKMYIDGKLVNSGDIAPPYVNDFELLIGRRGYDKTNEKGAYFKGMMDEMRIYTRALNDREIKELVTVFQ